ncbi:hypothetical protein Tco_1375752 [Tanacetum coccineum]
MCTYLRSLNEVDNCGKCKSLDIVLLDLQQSNKQLCELRKRFATLEEYNITLDIAFQNQKEQIIFNDPETKNKQFLVKIINNQSFEINDLKVKKKDKIHIINELKHRLAQLHGKSPMTQCESPNFDSRIQKIDDENVSLAFQVSSLVKEREHIKLEYKKLCDSMKQTWAKTKLQTDSLQQKLHDQISKNNKLKEQLKVSFFESQLNQNGTRVNTMFDKPSTSRTKLYSVTSLPKSAFIPKVVKENDLSKIVTSHLTTKKIIEKCTKALAIGLLKIESKPINAYFKNNRGVHHDYLKVTKEDVATLHELLEEARALKSLDEHIGRVSSTHASGSKPKSNTKNDRIQRTLSRSKKNKVEAHFRKFKSSDYKNNHVSDYNVNVKNIALSKNYDTICLSCNECLFPANHDACVV